MSVWHKIPTQKTQIGQDIFASKELISANQLKKSVIIGKQSNMDQIIDRKV